MSLLFIGTVIVAWQPRYLVAAQTALFVAALPEEWFFRAYFMDRLGKGWRDNVLASLLFSVLHGLTQGWLIALLVFAPSLFYGWLYQRTRDLPLVILVHALSNLVYIVLAAHTLETYIGVRPNINLTVLTTFG
jgi:membrane protease YdiL (CAAX protease family)